MENWVNSKREENEIVLSSRIRLARNIKDVPFPNKLSIEKGIELVSEIEKAFYITDEMKEHFKTINLWKNDWTYNRVFLEKHLISSKLLINGKKAAFILDNDETTSIMINEEDHLRLQCITSGLNLTEAYNEADRYDNLLEETIDFAFDEKLGYLTACPTNLGTGLRASVMIHLPALSSTNEMNEVLNALTQVGMTIRGLYGEGSKAEGCLYQISNQITLGLTEMDILNNLNAVVDQVIRREQLSREQILKNHKYELEDKIFRALGLLKSAVILSSKEGLNLLSNVRLGVEMGIVKEIEISKINELSIEVEPANLQIKNNKKLSEKERDIFRAKLVREKLN
ncbi:MAG TPA: protein arginine kinase [Clostridiaceae bacterium]